jgi:hypothetical protein
MKIPLLIKGNGNLRLRLGLFITLAGFLVLLIGTVPGLFGLDQSEVFGFLQIAVFEAGLGFICVGGYIVLNGLWNGEQKTIAADIGLRLIATGYTISVTSGLADLLGFGSQPSAITAYFGPWQVRGVVLGEIIIAVGLLLLVPYRHHAR